MKRRRASSTPTSRSKRSWNGWTMDVILAVQRRAQTACTSRCECQSLCERAYHVRALDGSSALVPSALSAPWTVLNWGAVECHRGMLAQVARGSAVPVPFALETAWLIAFHPDMTMRPLADEVRRRQRGERVPSLRTTQ